jgi:hypothetical protein
VLTRRLDFRANHVDFACESRETELAEERPRETVEARSGVSPKDVLPARLEMAVNNDEYRTYYY